MRLLIFVVMHYRTARYKEHSMAGSTSNNLKSDSHADAKMYVCVHVCAPAVQHSEAHQYQEELSHNVSRAQQSFSPSAYCRPQLEMDTVNFDLLASPVHSSGPPAPVVPST